MDSGEIFSQLDAAAEQCDFPDLSNGYYYAVDARLHVYRDAHRWALIIETVGYSPRARNLTDVLHTFGNCLTSGDPGFDNADFLDRIDNWDAIEDIDEPEAYSGASIMVRGHRIEVPAGNGAELVDILRRLVPDHRELLLADEAELRRRIPADIPEIMRLDQWHHPVDDLPSESTTFRQLTGVLATGDTKLYAPSTTPNTHWSHWPESGTL
ncbi:DUF7003 family protein [Actinoplanes derwentensis]|uniref:Uncharacterized protein n=1 Tax=Actinoplanes derwentensis TaxID=113562 RepID=A0A1H1Y289_9ACTN|nr:hypothetical protein [Actinoplanes derwentensis]GID86761.1 hypothetical protein Ade03nite_56850 [Actinoplanes derwentensis]SDT15309.1 hypothetical protein SAMN04489716_2670 [Actinoplanes derwentensis]